MTKPPESWCQALEAEYEALYGEPALDASAPADPRERLRALHARIHAKGPSALCLSGGGIRSATFALGVLQGLAYTGMLGAIDYLSTVSGGGYTGGWFTAWLHRQGAARRAEVLATIDPGPRLRIAADDDNPHEASPVERVRRTCRYLAPTGGVVSADVWTLVSTMTRNLVLNWLVILPLLAAALLIPRLYYGALYDVEGAFVGGPCIVAGDPASWTFAISTACFVICTGYVILNFVGLGGRWSQGRFLSCFLLPAIAGSVSLTFFYAAYPCQPDLSIALILSATVPAAGWIVLGAIAPRIRRMHGTDGGTLRVKVGIRTIFAALASGPVLGVGLWWLGSFQYGFGPGEPMRELYAVLAVPLVMSLALAQITMFIGLASSELDDAVLEWWSRCGAWIAIAIALWISAGFLVFFMADAVEFAVRAVSRLLAMDHAAGRTTISAIVAALVPLLSSLAGLASRASGKQGQPSFARLAFQKAALPLVILILLSTIAWVDLRASAVLEYHRVDAATLCTPFADPPCHAVGAGLGENVALFVALTAFGLSMSYFVPVNRFSLHGMYCQRLIRTFLGASRQDRRPNAFTGFDSNDDVRVHELADVRPLHVINTTLNAVSSTHVGRHERQSESFTFTPLHVGNRELGYRPASEYGSDGGGTGTGLSLGMALAVSGAAASPAMGMYSSHSRAFLLTLANARLGLWFGNPQDEKTCRRSEPPISVEPLMRELLGLTTDNNPYVYLSDGGHYENLGLWEMVARRCRFIIVSDAGCDPQYTFDDLANAVRRIRLDLGIPIQFSPIGITRAGQGAGNPHAAIGKIRYAVVDGPDAEDGTILYLKATVSGDEPVDVLNFASGDPTFPHDSTSNQFFDEARFESYRMLGFHTVLSIAPGLRNVKTVEDLCNCARKTLAAAAEAASVSRPSAATAAAESSVQAVTTYT